MGDFNLNAGRDLMIDYSYKQPMKALNEFVLKYNLLQLVKFKTWSRIIKGVKKESLLDHIYVTDVSYVIYTTVSLLD